MNTEQGKIKIEYEKPILIVLNGNVGLTEGTCAGGSGDSGNCYDGTNAGASCAPGTGFSGCLLGIVDATCTPSGSGPPM